MDAHRLRAPAADGALLAVPSLEEAGAALVENAGRLTRWDYDFQGRPADRLRTFARRQALEKAREFLANHGLDAPPPLDPDAPLIVTGHQPELFHPGVWVKNFAVDALARAHGGVGLNLIVDNDLVKSTTIRVPHLNGNAIGIERVDFDDWGGEIPYEDHRVRDEARFASFPDRARAALGGAVTDPILNDFWPRAAALRGKVDRTGLRFALARHALESDWGARNLEVPLSVLCETDSFLWVASHLLAHLPRFQAVHNAALARYRALYHIRSRHHPVPALGREGDWLEAPFWVWRAEEPRRRPLMVRQLARTMQLRIGGEEKTLLELPLSPDREACCAVEQLMILPAQQVRLRTRALTTTLFARLLLGDLFVHGIGGAKYDELGDEIIRGFFGIEPPTYLTLSMTLWLGLGTAPGSPDEFRALERLIRDLTFNPERHLDDRHPAPPEALAAKRAARAAPVETHRQRVARFHAIRRANESLQPFVSDRRAVLERDRIRMRKTLRRNTLAQHREYSFVLHSEARLREALACVRGGADRE